MLIAMIVALALVVVRLVDLQAVGTAHYAALARKQLIHPVTLSASRGAIFDRNGADLALSVPRPTIYADPSLVRDHAKTARALAPILGIPFATLDAELTKKTDASHPGRKLQFVYLARRVTADMARQVAARGILGIGQLTEPKREYPSGVLAAPVIGFVGSDGHGLGGLEAKYTRFLTGTPGSLEAERDPSGREIPATARREVPARRGGDLVLTVDQSLQYMAEQRLTSEVEATKAKGGMAVVVDVKTGEVLAMVNVDGATEATPTHAATPAHPSTAGERNRALTDLYEPGSTAKVITTAGALEAGAIDVNTRFSVPSSTTIGGQHFADDEPHGTADWTVREIISQSSNVGAIKIAALIGRQRLDRTMREFGFGARSAIDFPYEERGILQPPTSIDPSIMGSMPIGYGIATTAMQTLGVFTTVANGGMSRPARLVAATIDANGVRHVNPAIPGRRVISAQTASVLNALLQGVVRYGTGVKAAIPGYTVAGKTGTARKVPYVPPYKYMASFAGFAPAESPRFAAVVVLDEPQGQIYGGAVAAPVFSSIMEYALHLFHVAPTAPVGANAGTPSQPQPSKGARTGNGKVSAPVP